jgi:hypothetical protein
MKGPCGHGQLAIAGGGGPGGGVGVPGAQPRIGGAPAGHPGAAQARQGPNASWATAQGPQNLGAPFFLATAHIILYSVYFFGPAEAPPSPIA